MSDRLPEPVRGSPWGDGLPPPYAGPELYAYAWAVHGLFALGLLGGITTVPGVILGYLKRGEAAGTLYESHFTYAIRSFWIGLLLSLAGIALSFVLVGFLLLALVGIWWMVRIIRPVVALLEHRPIARPRGFL